MARPGPGSGVRTEPAGPSLARGGGVLAVPGRGGVLIPDARLASFFSAKNRLEPHCQQPAPLVFFILEWWAITTAWATPGAKPHKPGQGIFPRGHMNLCDRKVAGVFVSLIYARLQVAFFLGAPYLGNG